MVRALMPIDETARLEALDALHLLDSPAEREFDELAQLAAHICSAPIALVSLVDKDRQWFKSRVGLEVQETPIEWSFCAHAIRGDGLFEIPDATVDPRFAANALVTGPPYIRFYAGVPLETQEGFRVGTLCVIDTQPRKLTEDQKNVLGILTRQVMALIEGRRAKHMFAVTDRRVARIHRSMRDCLAQTDLEGRIVYTNPTFAEMLGYTMEECLDLTVNGITPPEWHDVEWPLLHKAFADSDYSPLYEKEYFRKDGTRIPVELQTHVLRTESGEPDGYWAIIRDITERKRAISVLEASELRYRRLFENITSGFALHEIICDDDGKAIDYRFLEVNPAFEALTGLVGEQIVGRTVLEVLPGTEQYWIEVYGRVALTGQPTYFDNYSAELGKYYDVWVFCPTIGQFAVVLSDVTDKKQIEAKLRNNEKRLSHSINATSDAIWEWNLESGELYFSPRWYEMLGIDEQPAYMTLEQWKSLTHPEDVEPTLAMVADVIEGRRETFDTEWRSRTATGEWRWILGRGKVVERGPNGEPLLFCGTNRDITELRQSQHRYGYALEAASDAIFQHDYVTGEHHMSRKWVEMLGYGPGELDYSRDEWLRMCHPDDFVKSTLFAEKVVADPEQCPSGVEFRVKTKSGDWMTVLARGRIVDRDPDGKPTLYVGTYTDITALRASEQRLARAFSATSDAIWEWNFATGETYYSPRWYEMLGYEVGEIEMTEEGWRALCHPDDLEPTLQAVAAADDGYRAEFRMRRKDGRWIWILGRGSIVERNEDGTARIFSGTNTDITRQKETERALQRLNDTLEARVVERTAELAQRNEDLELFSYTISHDLRAPLRAINGFATLLGEASAHLDVEEASRFAQRIAVNSSRMADMLDGILAYSRIGNHGVRPTRVFVRPFILKQVEEATGGLNTSSVRILAEIEDAELALDPEALSICLRNLLNNAVKFSADSPEPEIIVTARSEGQSYLISVKDNGVGFDMADAGRIFQIFERLRSKAPGTGVGLALVARAATRLGGRVIPLSEPGGGATFTLQIPRVVA